MYEQVVSKVLAAKGADDVTFRKVVDENDEAVGVDLMGQGWDMRIMEREDGGQSVWFHTSNGDAASIASAIVEATA